MLRRWVVSDAANEGRDKRLALTFTERVRLVDLGVSTNGEALPVRIDAATPQQSVSATVGALEPGIYNVKWSIVDGSGHVARGAFTFAISPR